MMLEGGEELQPALLEGVDFHESERQVLLETFQRRKACSCSPLLLISGPSGCGKTTLAKSLKQHVVEKKKGLFLSGKIDQFHKSNPLLGVVADCVALIKEDAKFLALLRDDLRLDMDVLVNGMPMLRDIFPVVAHATPHRDAEGAQSSARFQFKLLFCRFLRSVCNILDRPVVLFVDDLQWAREELFDLLSDVLLDRDIENLTVLSACREVTQDHQLSNFLQELHGQGVAITDIVLSNISADALKKHVSTILGGQEEGVESLSNLLYQITGGNHLFFQQVVTLMLNEGLLYRQGEAWEWKQKDVMTRFACEDIQSFVSAKLQRGATVSCLGNGLDQSLLAAAVSTNDDSRTTSLVERLSEAVDQGYLVLSRQSLWSFSHDQIQHAAYDLIRSDEKELFHLSLGRRLLMRLSAEVLDQHYVLVVRQLLRGSSQITKQCDRLETCFYFLEAGKRAGQASSFEEAIAFFNVAIDFLPQDHWKSQYDLSLELYNGAAEIECALGNFEHVDSLLATAIRNEIGIDDKMRSYTAQVLSLGARNRYDELIAKVKDVLREAGFPLPKKVTKVRLVLELARTKSMTPRDIVGSIEDQPIMKNRRMLAAIRLMILTESYAFWKGGLLFVYLGLRIFQLSMKHGLCGMSAMGFASYASMLCVIGSVQEGYQVGVAALRVLDRFDAREWRCRVLTCVTNFVRVWVDPVSHLQKINAAIPRIGLDTGDTEYAVLALGTYVQQGAETAPSLEAVLSRMKASHELMDRYKQSAISAMCAPTTQAYANLLGQYEGNDPWILTGTYMVEVQDEASIQKLFAANLKTWLSIYCAKTFVAVVLGEFEQARLAMKRLSPAARGVENELFHPYFAITFYVLYTVSHLADTSHRPNYRRVRRCLRRLKRLAVLVPECNSCKLYWVQAELCHRMGKYNQAKFYYETACATAQHDGVVYVNAIARERLSALRKTMGQLREARRDLITTRSVHEEWGCAMKVRQLDAAIENFDL